jgi:hypothetical protein
MRRRIAHRPRYRNAHHLPPLPRNSHKDYLRNHWTYRRLTIPYQKHPLGQGLLFLNLGYRLVRSMVMI